MTVHKHILVLGDNNERAPYHPLSRIQDELAAILGDGYAIDMTDNYSALDPEIIHSYDLMIAYTDCWTAPVTERQAASLIQFVQRGGSLLVIHNGISLQSREACAKLIGGKFTGHPDYQRLDFSKTAIEHPVTSGIEPFSLEEEPYQFEFYPDASIDVLLEYSLGDRRIPAAWTATRGQGRIVYLMPGHHMPSFLHPSSRRLIQNSAQWLTEAAAL
ncbi:ThuA domain-containing protein [Paenibacillus silvisoli]|uniref:ThuA domain-containing protein n=1 Tax=Paenibacillus silvisoli TaxID=3110539 RepID=UPI00280465AD|nr:ThuA domain-containing protein [Paenibacillus silvisoli]